MRLAQLDGMFALESIAYEAVWGMLPRALRRSTPLLAGADALILALDFFFSWQPFADERLFQSATTGIGSQRLAAIRQVSRTWEGTRRIPNEVKLAIRHRMGAHLLPEDANPDSWWGTFFSPQVRAQAKQILS
jgi:hypothetical protein